MDSRFGSCRARHRRLGADPPCAAAPGRWFSPRPAAAQAASDHPSDPSGIAARTGPTRVPKSPPDSVDRPTNPSITLMIPGDENYLTPSERPARRNPPRENPAVTSPDTVRYALHEAIVMPLPGNPHAPSLAESDEVAPDLMSATFKLREGARFHNGDSVTPEDAKFPFGLIFQRAALLFETQTRAAHCYRTDIASPSRPGVPPPADPGTARRVRSPVPGARAHSSRSAGWTGGARLPAQAAQPSGG